MALDLFHIEEESKDEEHLQMSYNEINRELAKHHPESEQNNRAYPKSYKRSEQDKIIHQSVISESLYKKYKSSLSLKSI